MAVLQAIVGEAFTATLSNAATGLAGSLGYTLLRMSDESIYRARTTVGIVESASHSYSATIVAPSEPGSYIIKWDIGTEGAGHSGTQALVVIPEPKPSQPESGLIPVEDTGILAGPDLTDLKVLVPRAKRKIEGPWGPPEGKTELTDSVVYDMVADACGEIVLLSGSFFGHELLVKARDPTAGYPTAWRTAVALNEWETALICSQVALNYYFYLFRDMRTSQTIKNEGTEFTYSLSANVLKNYLEMLVKERDDAITALRGKNFVLDRFASNIRVRDQATVAALEWWSGEAGSPLGIPGGQEAAVVPVFYGPGNEFP